MVIGSDEGGERARGSNPVAELIMDLEQMPPTKFGCTDASWAMPRVVSALVWVKKWLRHTPCDDGSPAPRTAAATREPLGPAVDPAPRKRW